MNVLQDRQDKAAAVQDQQLLQDHKADLFSDLSQHVWPLFAEGRLKPQLERSFAVKEAELAFAELAGNGVNGKLVLVIDSTLA